MQRTLVFRVAPAGSNWDTGGSYFWFGADFITTDVSIIQSQSLGSFYIGKVRIDKVRQFKITEIENINHYPCNVHGAYSFVDTPVELALDKDGKPLFVIDEKDEARWRAHRYISIPDKQFSRFYDAKIIFRDKLNENFVVK